MLDLRIPTQHPVTRLVLLICGPVLGERNNSRLRVGCTPMNQLGIYVVLYTKIVVGVFFQLLSICRYELLLLGRLFALLKKRTRDIMMSKTGENSHFCDRNAERADVLRMPVTSVRSLLPARRKPTRRTSSLAESGAPARARLRCKKSGRVLRADFRDFQKENLN